MEKSLGDQSAILSHTDEPNSSDVHPAIRNIDRLGIIIFLIASILVAIVAVMFITEPVSKQLGFVSDDAFYYLQIARQITQLHGSTFDGVNPTNGYQPAWMVVCVLLAAVIKSRIILLKAYILIEFAVTVVSGQLLAKFLKRFTPETWAWSVAAAWIVSPFTLQVALTGTETPLYWCALLLLLQQTFRCVDEPGRKNLMYLGLLFGLCLLCRTDAVFPCAASLAIVRWKKPVIPVQDILRTAVYALLVYSPWLVISFLTVHSIEQDSGAMKAFWKAHDAPVGLGASLIETWHFIVYWVGYPLSVFIGGHWTAHLFAVLLATAIAIGLTARARRPAKTVAIWCFIVIVLSGIIYGFSIGDVQHWHFGLPAIAMFTAAGVLVGAEIIDKPRRTCLLFTGVLLMFAGFSAFRAKKYLTPAYPWQGDVLASQQAWSPQVPLGATIGCFNAGIPAYFSNIRVINLDGLVNHTATHYWKNHEFDQYVRDNHIAYIFDERYSFDRSVRFSKTPLKVVAVATWPLTGWTSKLRYFWHVAN